MRTKNFVAIVIANFFLIPVFAENNKIDSVLILLRNSLKENGKDWDGNISDFKKIDRHNEVICYLYPEFVYFCQNGETPCSKTRITIHFIKEDFLRKDTFFYSGIKGEQKFVILTKEKKLLPKNSFLIEIETPVGSNNAYYQTKKIENVVNWMTYILCTNNKNGLKTKGQFYDEDMQIYMGVYLKFNGMYCKK